MKVTWRLLRGYLEVTTRRIFRGYPEVSMRLPGGFSEVTKRLLRGYWEAIVSFQVLKQKTADYES